MQSPSFNSVSGQGAPPAFDRHGLDPGLPAALVHDWLLGMRGGEWVLACLLELFPDATIHTMFYRPESILNKINQRSIHPGLLNALPAVGHYYRWLLPLMPWAASRLRFDREVRLILSISHCVAHGIQAPSGARHAIYYLSPMRYLYDQARVYRQSGGLGARLLEPAAPALRRWDQRAAARPDATACLSEFVADRIEGIWGRRPEVIHPPVRTRTYRPPERPERLDEDLVVSAMVPYKRVELIVSAANRIGRPLRVVGDGPILPRVRQLAGPTVTVEGRVSQARLLELYQTRRALIFGAEEDFGLVPLEANACGMPVLALRAGALTETMREGVTGGFFEEPNIEALTDAWRAFEPETLDPGPIRAHAEQFSEAYFLGRMAEFLRRSLD